MKFKLYNYSDQLSIYHNNQFTHVKLRSYLFNLALLHCYYKTNAPYKFLSDTRYV